jgi:hypothetical protein
MQALTHTQEKRRKAIKDLDEAAHLYLFTKPDATGRITLSRRGIIAVGGITATGYYLLRLLLRDLLHRYPWYRLLQKKADRTKLFELYFLSILNAAIMGGHSVRKLIVGGHHGTTRMLSAALGYFVHDFYAMRYEFRNDVGMLFHHLIAIYGSALCVGRPQLHKYVATWSATELSSVFLGLRWLLAETGQTSTRAYKAVLVLFGSSFFATRIWNIWRPGGAMRTLWDDPDVQKLPWWHPLRGGVTALSCLNIFWFWKILKMARRQFAQ